MDGGATGTMRCKNCEEYKRKFYCENCLRGHLRTHKQRLKIVTDIRDKHVASAVQALGPMNERRLRRAKVAELQRSIQRHRDGEKRAMTEIEALKEELKRRRAILVERREALAQAYAQFPYLSTGASSTATLTPSTANAKDPPGAFISTRRTSRAALTRPPIENPIDTINAAIATLKDQHAQLTREITGARQTLVQELVDVFHIVEVGGRPALNVGRDISGSMNASGRGGEGLAISRAGSARGKRGDWQIAGLLMCVPGDVGRYPPLRINAAITHTLHFLHLLTFYLGVKLPFEVVWLSQFSGSGVIEHSVEIDGDDSTTAVVSTSGGSRFRYGKSGDGGNESGMKRGVGAPWIFAGKGGESGGWSRWTTKNPLHLPSTSSGQGSPASSPSSSTHRSISTSDARPSTPTRPALTQSSQSSPNGVVSARPRTVSSSSATPSPPSAHRTVSAPTTPTAPSSGYGLSLGIGLGIFKPYLGIVGGYTGLSPSSSQSGRHRRDSNASESDSGNPRGSGKYKDKPAASFTTGLAMLLYNVAYLAHTQGVDIPLAQTGEILRNLWAVCCSPELGRHSHETHPLLPNPTPPSFHLEFAQLLQATTAEPVGRSRSRRFSTGDNSGSVVASKRLPRRKRIGREGVIIEEDEWDLIDDAL